MNRTILKPILALFIVLFFASCSKDDFPSGNPDKPSPSEVEVEYRVTGTSEINPLKVILLHTTVGNPNIGILINNQKEVLATLPYSYKFKQPLTSSIRASDNKWYTRAFVKLEMLEYNFKDLEEIKKVTSSKFNIEIYFNGKLAFQQTFQPSAEDITYITPDINYTLE